MKTKLILGFLSAMVISANGAITIAFTNPSTGTLSNFQNGAGSSSDPLNVSNRMVWGILVDSQRDGFDSITSGLSYKSGFSLAANSAGLALSLNTSVVTDDVLYIAGSVMASTNTATNLPNTGESPANQNRILSFTGFNFNAGLGVDAGDKIAIIWFNQLALGGTTTDGLKYGIYELPSVLFDATNFANVLPADNGGSYTFAPAFAGADPSKAMGYALGVIPEPSSAFLGLVGALGLLRRRRN